MFGGECQLKHYHHDEQCKKTFPSLSVCLTGLNTTYGHSEKFRSWSFHHSQVWKLNHATGGCDSIFWSFFEQLITCVTNREAPQWSRVEVITGRGQRRYGNLHCACNKFQFENIWNGRGGKKYPSFCTFCLLWQNRTLIYRHCKLCRSALFRNFHWWRNCFTAPSSFSTATITTDVNTLVNDLSSHRRTRGPKAKQKQYWKQYLYMMSSTLPLIFFSIQKDCLEQ